MENINWHLLPAEELDKKVDEYLAGTSDISDAVAQQILLRHAELVKRGEISATEGYLARKKAAQRVMVPNTNFLKQVLKQTIGTAATDNKKRARSASDSDDERASKRIKHETRHADDKDEVRMGPQPPRVMRGRGSSGASVLDAVFGEENKDHKTKHKRDKKHKKKHDKKHKKHKKDKQK